MHLAVSIVLFFLLISFSHQVLSQSSPFNTSIIRVYKDASVYKNASTTLHRIFLWPNYIIDLDAPFTWNDCVDGPFDFGDTCTEFKDGCRFPLSCSNHLCKEAQSYDPNPNCPSFNITTKYGCKICPVTPFNPVSNKCKLSQLTTYTGRLRPFGIPFVSSCAPSSLLSSLPRGVRGVAAFSWSNLAFPRQLSQVADKFALCLPNSTGSSASGVIYLGDGPFYFNPSPSLDIRTILSYTPMIRKSSKSLGYYIKLNRISINGTQIHLPTLKTESVKLSTVLTYTTLRSDIYKALVTGFSKATKSIPRAIAESPFNLCLKASVRSVHYGFHVPNIELETESGKVWTISGDNSMERSTWNGAACLAFIDGGSQVKDAIVIGTFQMENNFLFFDLENQKLGFSSSLSVRGTQCSSANFTKVPE